MSLKISTLMRLGAEIAYTVSSVTDSKLKLAEQKVQQTVQNPDILLFSQEGSKLGLLYREENPTFSPLFS